jgi:gentisate 1,2-dioxygenase
MAKTLDDLELRALLGVDPDPGRAAGPHAANARYLSSLDGFNIKRPAIPAHVFGAERDRALAPGAPTGLYPLDLSARLEVEGPATTPLILARYARIRAGEGLATAFRASTELHYVIAGAGRTAFGAGGAESVAWGPGDVVCLPGGGAVHHQATADTALWVVTNEPQLAFERCAPPGPGQAPIAPAHYPAAEIRRRLYDVYRDPRGAAMPGKSINFGNAAIEGSRTTTPTCTLAMNSLLPGESQRPHRHNAVAVTLVVAADRCYSLIDGERADWEPNTVMITPPTRLHSHHNAGGALALFLIVQDGGLYYHCRTMGFSWE